jgi:hypothetical protein
MSLLETLVLVSTGKVHRITLLGNVTTETCSHALTGKHSAQHKQQ